MPNVGSLNINLKANTTNFASGIQNAGKRVKSFHKGVDTASISIKKMVGVMAGLAGVVGLSSLVRSQNDLLNSTADLADQLNASTQSIMGLRYAAKMSGNDMQTMDKSLAVMVKRIGSAVEGTGAAINTLKNLGLDANKLTQQAPGEAFKVIADAISRLPTQAQRSSAAFDIFSDAGKRLISTLQLGSKGIEALEKENAALGNSFSRLDIEKLAGANDAIDRIKTALTGLVNSSLIQVAPLIDRAASGIANLLKWVRSLSPYTKMLALNTLKWATGIGLAITLAPRIVGAVMSIVKSFRAMASASAILQALSGPAGWATLAVGVTIAAGTIYALDTAFDKVEQTATQGMSSVVQQTTNLGNAVKQTIQQVRQLAAVIPQLEMNHSIRFEGFGIIEGLKQQIREFGRANDELQIYKLRMSGATTAMINHAVALQRTLNTTKANQSIKDLIQTFHDGADAIGHTTEQMQIQKLAMNRLTDPSLIAQATKALDELTRKREAFQKKQEAQQTAAQKMQSMQSEARSIFESTRTPMERFTARMGKLKTFLSEGLLSWDTYRRGVDQAKESLRSAIGQMSAPKGPELIRAGSAAAQRFQYEFQNRMGAGSEDQYRKKTEDYQKKSLNQLVLLNRNFTTPTAGTSIQVYSIPGGF